MVEGFCLLAQVDQQRFTRSGRPFQGVEIEYLCAVLDADLVVVEAPGH